MQTLVMCKQSAAQEGEKYVQPAKSENRDQSNLLSPNKLKTPNAPDRQSSDQKVCNHVRAAVGIAKCFLVHALGNGPFQYVPKGVDRNACECKGEECDKARSDGQRHYNVYWDSCFFDGEDSTILCQDGDFGEREADAVSKNAPIKVLPWSVQILSTEKWINIPLDC